MRILEAIMRRTRVILAGAVILLAGGAGACHDPAATEATAVRQARIRGHLDRFAAREASGPRRLREAGQWCQRQERRHADQSRHNSRRLGRWWQRDLERWEGDGAEYRRRIEAYFEGDPASIEFAFQAMFY
jgi:hypothetical protein